MLKLEEIINLLENDGDIKENVSLKTLTTLKVGGISKYVFYPKNVTSLKKALTLFKENNINYKIFGNGSNIIPSDKIYDGVIIKLSSLNNLKINDEVIEVEAGYSLYGSFNIFGFISKLCFNCTCLSKKEKIKIS